MLTFNLLHPFDSELLYVPRLIQTGNSEVYVYASKPALCTPNGVVVISELNQQHNHVVVYNQVSTDELSLPRTYHWMTHKYSRAGTPSKALGSMLAISHCLSDLIKA